MNRETETDTERERDKCLNRERDCNIRDWVQMKKLPYRG